MVELEGKTLDRYVLQRLIGRGGMANVYQAYDSQTGRTVAVKIFKREDDDMLYRFNREAALMARLRHSHLVPVYDIGQAHVDNQTFHYIVMPLLEGGTLRTYIRRNGPLSLTQSCHAIRDIASALDYIHGEGIIHRDIKASNVLMSDDGNFFLTDFGIARITGDATHLTSTGNVLGTVDYVAPELFEVDRRADQRSDLYSLGVLLYEMVTGRLPFTAENQIALVSMHMNKRPPAPSSIVPGIPTAVEEVILKALEKRPEHRYASATELANTFCRAVTSTSRENASAVPRSAPPVWAPPLRPDQLLLSTSGQNQVAGNAGVPPQVRPSPLAEGTEGFVLPAHRPSPYPQPASPAQPQLSPAPPLFALPPAFPVSPPPMAPQPYYRRPWFIALLFILAFAIIAGSAAIAFFPRGTTGTNPGSATTGTGATNGATNPATTIPSPTANLTATAQAALAATQTAQVQATQTAIAGVTATAGAQASATAGVIQTATSGKPSYQDSLKDPNNPATVNANWDQNGQCRFQSDGYHVTTGSGLKGCREATNSYQNVAITVDMRIVSGQSGGLFFRITTNLFGQYAGYLFEVDTTGRYRISKSDRFDQGKTVLLDWTATPALHKGLASNTLQVIAHNSDLFFYANGAYLARVTDGAYSSGVVAFLAMSDGSTPADIAYTDLNVYPTTT